MCKNFISSWIRSFFNKPNKNLTQVMPKPQKKFQSKTKGAFGKRKALPRQLLRNGALDLRKELGI